MLGLVACGDANEGPGSSQASQIDPVVLAAERVFGVEGRTYFISILPDAPTADLDRSTAIEIGGSADIEVYGGAIYIRNRDNNVITRYRALDDFTLRPDGEVSFANKGLSTSARYHNAYLTPDRAYLLDPIEWRLIEWNPTTMTLSTTEDIPVGFMKKAALPAGTFGVPARVGTRIISPIYWQQEFNIYAGSGAAIVLDATDPAPPTFAEDPRVGGAYRVYGKDNGDMFVVGSVGGDVRAFGTAVGGAMPGSGILRIAAGETTFDPSYFVDVAAITGSPGIAVIHRLDDTHVLAQVFDPDAPFPATASAYSSSGEFIWVMIDTSGDSPTFERVAALDKGGRANGGSHIVDGSLYIQYQSTTGSIVKRVDSDRSIHDAFSVPAGDLWHLQRIR